MELSTTQNGQNRRKLNKNPKNEVGSVAVGVLTHTRWYTVIIFPSTSISYQYFPFARDIHPYAEGGSESGGRSRQASSVVAAGGGGLAGGRGQGRAKR